MARILDTADSRGIAKHDWLFSQHTFSFASYHNPKRMGFGLLRVINDDIVQPSMGFATHPHENMEIISIPLSGSLRHEDSMGNQHLITVDEIQVMSAGTGITHSEYNNSENDEVNFLQIWVMPKELGIKPRYDQRKTDLSLSRNSFSQIVAPMGTEDVVTINQDAYFSIANLDAGKTANYAKHKEQHGVYVFVIDGKIDVGESKLSKRDGIGITDEDGLVIVAQEPSKVLCIEIPMQ